MTNIKQALEAEKRKREAKERERRTKEYDSPGRQRDRSNAEKAKRLSTFAGPVIQRFATETNKVAIHQGTSCDMYRECLAVYGFYRRVKSFLSVKLHPMFEVVIGTRGYSSEMGGFTAGHVVVIGSKASGDNIPLEGITEDWFASILAEEYLDWEQRWRWTGR